MKRVLPAAVVPVLVFAFSLFVLVGSAHAVSNSPGAEGLTAVSGAGEGQVTLTWKQNSPLTQSYTVLYGTAPRVYQYSLLNLTTPGLGGQKQVTIGALVPGRTYYFVIQPNGGEHIGLSNEAMANGYAVSDPALSTWVDKAGGAISVTAASGSQSGQVEVSWKQDVIDVSSFSVVYGTEPGKYVHALRGLSAVGLGGTKSVAIGALNPGQMYYFAVETSGPGTLHRSVEVSATAAK